MEMFYRYLKVWKYANIVSLGSSKAQVSSINSSKRLILSQGMEPFPAHTGSQAGHIPEK